MNVKLAKKEVLGITVTDEQEDKILEYVMDFIKKGQKGLFITTPNPEILVYAKHHKDFATILNGADISLPDGVGVVVASTILGKSLKSRITGVDFMKNLCEKIAKKPITVGFLGGKPNIALIASECLKREFLGLSVKLAESGNPDEKTVKSIQEKFTKSQPLDVLFVGFGFPKQEQWIYDHLDALPVRVLMTVGGSFDIVSGSLRRAPSFMRNVGLEWLWRLIIQPWRWKRQLKLLEFIFLVFKERIGLASK
jgi:N-acetylglucosaminyldiphosphoundecaprenol N-acetyl-beta-D-mannosaminyltransferase